MKNLGFIYAIAAAIIWGLVYTIDQKILAKISPFGLIFAGSLLGVIILAPFFIFKFASIKELLSIDRPNLLLILSTVALSLLANFFIFSSIKLLGASVASIFEITYPFFVVLFCVLLFKQSINAFFLLGSVLIFIGSLIIIKFG